MRTYDRRGVLAAGAALAAGAWVTRLERAPAALARRPRGTLRYYSWFDYVSPQTTAAFEKTTGLRVDWSYFVSNEALASRLRSATGSYDLAWWLIIGSGVYAALMHLPIRERPLSRAMVPAGA